MLEEESMRRARLEKLRQAGVEPYPAKVERTHTVHAYIADFEQFEKNKTMVTLAGRVKTLRKHGGLTFLSVTDESGTVQFALRKDTVGEDAYAFFHETADMGDFLEATGTAFVTKKGEKSLDIQSYSFAAKTLLPLPEKWHGLTDTETRFRKRYLDLIANPSSMEFARARSRMVSSLRTFLEEEGFMEVETPILQPIAGGAAAKPFITHHNALGHDFYLRIAPELYLKRLLVGGFEKIFEFARCFRNEGISPQHNPEFTQIEAYWAYATIEDLLAHFERMLAKVIPAVAGGMIVQHGEDALDFSSIPRITFRDAILAETRIDIDAFADEDALRQEMETNGVKTDGVIGMSELLDHLWKTRVRSRLVQPTFVLDYPAVMKPLAKVRPENPRYSAGAQLVVRGMEVVNGFNEQNDPLVQERVFEEQELLREKGSEEAQMVDMDYLDALKHGMPPAAGYGIGIDRLAMILTGAENIKEVILFPTLRPEQEN